jgi:hypothetical protein
MKVVGVFVGFIILVASLFLFESAYKPQTMEVGEVIKKTLDSVQAAKVLTFTFTRFERINGKMATSSSAIKLETRPFKLYLKTLGADGGKEVAYGVEKHNKAVVSPNAFPYVTLYLDPYSSLLRENQHHTIFEIGFTYFARIMAAYSLKIANKHKEFCAIDGDVEWGGRKCISVTCNYPSFAYVKYTAKKDETLTTIANRLLLSDYMMLEKNSENVSYYDDVDENEEILIPNSYCKKITFYVDKANYLPIRQMIYDDQGLFEEYHYLNVVKPK